MNSLRYPETNTLQGHLIAFTIGFLVGLRISPMFVGLIYVAISGVCVYLAFQQNVKTLLCTLPYLVYTEMFIRTFVTSVPYLFMQYLFCGVFFILLLTNKSLVRPHSRTFFLLIFFILIELINSTRSSDPDVTRGLIINSLGLVLAITWASCNVITPVLANRILINFKYAGVYLCGYIVDKYIFGNPIFVSAHSGSEGTNGLAPVQLSAYLGFTCTLFFFSILNGTDKKNLLINIVALCLSVIFMMLTFSRGGLYFFAILVILYFFFNRTNFKNYFSLILFIPLALVVYNIVSQRTNGLIEQRYEQEGTSGRSDLVKAGWQLFLSAPLAGVGVGNYNTTIYDTGLYGGESGAHNEFIRVAAEDGIPGIITYWSFYIFLFFEILRRKRIQKEYAIYFFVFFCLVTVHNGLKISLQPLLMLLAVGTSNIPNIMKTKYVRRKEELAI